MAEAVVPKWLMYVWAFALVLMVVYLLMLIAQEVQGKPIVTRKPCHGCSDADLGLTLEEAAK